MEESKRVSQILKIISPSANRWMPLTRVTLIGDAAHLMTPFAGVGVNLAMEDALILARSLKKHRGGSAMLTKGLQEFESDMFERAEAGATLTYQNLVEAYGKPESHTF